MSNDEYKPIRGRKPYAMRVLKAYVRKIDASNFRIELGDGTAGNVKARNVDEAIKKLYIVARKKYPGTKIRIVCGTAYNPLPEDDPPPFPETETHKEIPVAVHVILKYRNDRRETETRHTKDSKSQVKHKMSAERRKLYDERKARAVKMRNARKRSGK